MGSPGNCTQQDIDNNAKSATRAYYPVSTLVVSTSSANGTITIQVPLVGGGSTQVTLKWGDQSTNWPACPSSLPSQATPSNAGPLPAVNSSGKLYLSAAYLSVNPTIAYDPQKWPASYLGGVPYAPLEVWASSLVLTGVETTTGAHMQATIDLLDPDFAEVGQAITTERCVMTLRLGPRAFRRFKVAMPDLAALEDAVTTIEASKKPANSQDAHQVAQAWRSVAEWMAHVQSDPPAGSNDGADDLRAEARTLLKKVTEVE